MKTLLTTLLLIFAFVGQSQTLVSILPATGTAGSSVNVTIKGNGTAFTNSSIFFLSSGTSILMVSDIVALSATSVQATVSIPANAVSGAYTLTTLAGIIPIQLPGAFTVTGGGSAGASIQSIDPDRGSQGQLIAITISGSNTTFTQSSNTTAVLIQGLGTPITSIDADAMDDTTLTCYFEIPGDAALGAYSLLLTTANDGILIKPNAFTVNVKRENSVTPNQGIIGETLDVTILFESVFTETSGIVVEFFETESVLTVNAITKVNDSTLRCNITIPTDARFGFYDVYIELGGRHEFLWRGFQVNRDPATLPRIVSINPATARQGEELDITISGVNTLFAQASESYMAVFYQAEYVEPTSFDAKNDSVIVAHFNIPDYLPTGRYGIYVSTDMDGYMEFLQSFTITKATGIFEENKALEQLNVYPNPVKNELMFETNYSVQGVYVTDITGKQITIPIEEIKQYRKVYTVDIERYRMGKGIYFIRVETDQGIQYQKFIVD